uniref:Uncharacterized protein n=1 Tax=Anopheles christyi TaxID=43041 RepID=A0A182K8D5_9DIPT
MPAMAHRCSPSATPLPATSVPATLPTLVTPPTPSSFVTQDSSRPVASAEGTGTQHRTVGAVVCGLIGKFECTRFESTDVKVTANSSERASDNALITDRASPITSETSPPEYDGQAPTSVRRFREIVATGNRNECSDKLTTTTTMGVGGTGHGRMGKCTGERMLNSEMDACVHRLGGERQRKTVVYSRLCLDDALLLEDAGLLGTDARPSVGPAGNGSTDHIEGKREAIFWSSSSSSPSSRQAEVIRFPCVERLIELYANIIRQKEAEVQRFMSSIVRSGDKSRLDKDGRRRAAVDGSHGSQLQQGDIRKKPALPASVSLESLSRTKTLVGDSTAQSIEDAVRVSRTQDSSSPAQSDEGWRSSTQPASPYGSSDEEEQGTTAPSEHLETSEEATMKNRDKVTRSSSSDSALGLDDELSVQEQQQAIATVGKVRRLTLGVSDIPLRAALLPVPEPSTLPSLTATLTDQHCPTVVRSKMILEAQVIELPLGDTGTSEQQSGQQQQQLGCPPSTSVSRRESAQSYVSDIGEGVRYVRTPSVVVSDYSDDTMCGITLEEIEYFRRHRLRRGSADCESDISAASSCSNLNYCGSSISALDGCEYQCGLRTPERKVSDCSTCSTVSCDEDEGYSVVRAKLANLHLLPTETVTEESETPPPKSVAPAGGLGNATTALAAAAATAVATTIDPVSGETGDVRVCSKKKVSHVANSSG